MKKGIGTPENRARAFRVYEFFGGRDVPGILARLDMVYGLKVSARTLYQWKEEDDWDGRIASEKGGNPLTFGERMLLKVMDHIERYERQFAENPAVTDNQASYAYTNLLRTAIGLAGNMRRWESKDPEALRSIRTPAAQKMARSGSIREESEA